MYLFDPSPRAVKSSPASGRSSAPQTRVERFTQGILEDISGAHPGFYQDLLSSGQSYEKDSNRTRYSYSFKTAVARSLSTWPLRQLAIHDPLGDWKVQRALDLAADGGPLRIQVGDRLNSRDWTREEFLAAISEYEFTHRGIVNLTLHPIGSPIQLSLELSGRKDGRKKSCLWSLRGASKLMPSHRNILRLLNSAVEDRLERLGWLKQYESKPSRPGISSETIAELEQLTAVSYPFFDFSFLAPGAYLTEVDDCYESGENRRIYFSRCPSCELPLRAEAVENWGYSKETDWKSNHVLSMFAIDRRLNEILLRETKEHCSYRGPIFSARNGLDLLG